MESELRMENPDIKLVVHLPSRVTFADIQCSGPDSVEPICVHTSKFIPTYMENSTPKCKIVANISVNTLVQAKVDKNER